MMTLLVTATQFTPDEARRYHQGEDVERTIQGRPLLERLKRECDAGLYKEFQFDAVRRLLQARSDTGLGWDDYIRNHATRVLRLLKGERRTLTYVLCDCANDMDVWVRALGLSGAFKNEPYAAVLLGHQRHQHKRPARGETMLSSPQMHEAA